MSSTYRIDQITRLWRTATFRLAVVGASIFGIGAAAILVLLDFGIARFAEQELRGALRHQMAIMRADATLEGGAALVKILGEHVRTDRINRYRYLVVPPSGNVFNSGLPENARQIHGFGIARATADDLPSIRSESPVEMLVLTERMADGTFIAVGRENYPLDDLRAGLHRVALWGGLSLILLAIVAGALSGILFLRRLEQVNTTTGRIMEGNLSERLPAIGFGQEFHDLTYNLNAMLDRMETAMAAMEQISADIAHDLRMPLTRLRNRLEEIDPVSDEQARQVEGAIGEADELLGLFNAMLRLARLEAGSTPPNMAPVDIAVLAERAVEAYQPAAEQGGRKLLIKRGPPQFIMADATLINQLLANLIDNSLYHTPAGTRVEVSVESSPGGTRLTVMDDGPGVPEGDIANLTKRFFRVDHSRTLPGTGLGLTLVAAIVQRHKASLRISNRHPGLCTEVLFAE